MQIWNKSRLFEIKKSSRMKSSYRRLFSKYQRLMQYRKQTSLRLCVNRERIMPAFNWIGMGNSCKPMAVSFQCMTKFTTKKKKSSFSPVMVCNSIFHYNPLGSSSTFLRLGFTPWDSGLHELNCFPWEWLKSWPMDTYECEHLEKGSLQMKLIAMRPY